VQTDLDNAPLVRTIGLTLLDTQFHSQDSIGFGTTTTHERLDAPFRISPGITLPLGAEYDYSRYWVRGQAANRRVLALNARYERGSFYSGTRTQTIAGLTLRARPGYIVYMNGEWNDVRLRSAVSWGGNHVSDGFSGLATTSMSSIPTTGGGPAGGAICQPGQKSFL